MKAAFFGTSGIVSQGILREFQIDGGAEAVLTLGHTPIVAYAKIPTLMHLLFVFAQSVCIACTRTRYFDFGIKAGMILLISTHFK